MHTSRLTRVPGDPVLVQKIFAPTPALQAYSSLHSSKSGRRLRVSGRPEVSPWNTRATGIPKTDFRGGLAEGGERPRMKLGQHREVKARESPSVRSGVWGGLGGGARADGRRPRAPPS